MIESTRALAISSIPAITVAKSIHPRAIGCRCCRQARYSRTFMSITHIHGRLLCCSEWFLCVAWAEHEQRKLALGLAKGSEEAAVQ